MPKCYGNASPIKHAKYQNIMLLAQQYVGKNDFYHSLKSNKAEVEVYLMSTDTNSSVDSESY